jgi:uncharacterized membrane protein
MTQTLVLIVAFIVANLPWLSNRLFYVVPLKANNKNMAWCILELIVLYFLVGFLAIYAEYAILGETSQQSWEFYAITASLFLVFAFPGFIYKTLWK